MALTPRKQEVEAVAEAMSSHEDLDKAAKEAIKESFKILQRREMWIIATDAHIIYGPWESEAAAYAALSKGEVPGFEDHEDIKAIRKAGGIPTLGGQAAVLPIKGPMALAEGMEDLDLRAKQNSERLCTKCNHKLLAHGVKKNSAGCTVRGCKCKAAEAAKG